MFFAEQRCVKIILDGGFVFFLYLEKNDMFAFQHEVERLHFCVRCQFEYDFMTSRGKRVPSHMEADTMYTRQNLENLTARAARMTVTLKMDKQSKAFKNTEGCF